MKTQNDSLNLKGFKFLVVVLTFTLLVLSFTWPVWAQISCEDVLHSKCCPSTESCSGANYGNQGCPIDRPICCDSCTLPVEEGGIFNPVIGILGRQPGQVTVGYLVAAFLRLAYMFGSLMVLVFFIWGAIGWMTAGGSPESVQKAQARMTNAFIGLILLAGTYLLAVILGTILHINLLEIVLPKPIK